jgi:hypothetical protein
MSENKFGLFIYYYYTTKKEHQIDALLNTLLMTFN